MGLHDEHDWFIDEKFVKQHHQKQETRNNCFGLKKRSTTLLQAKTGKHECRNITGTLLLYFSTRAYLFSPEQGSCYTFLTRNNCCKFLTSYVIIQRITQSFLKMPVCGVMLH